MDKAELIRRRSNMQGQLAQKRQQITILSGKLERLKSAKVRLISVIHDSKQYQRKIKSFDTDSSLWRGTTQNKYETLTHHMEQSLNEYVHHLGRVEDRMNEEIQRLSNQLDRCHSDISFLNSNISNLTYSIQIAKEG
ncbi:DUF5082 domain-containing protein [Heyndrickxia sporothermodurans]|uniref:Uncharacterized protein n=1 Tax=Heyndrickxia sporothermodurans TaxID=46224 RepID=A0A150KMB5_9BACI|nr:DUF5082 domain-containing protein [Heyndrickxia sporothermodurans]KYC97183.1 hypothetical protein B4102_0838 [Heyndrickxia sporothermodurans]MEB6550355.1 DUF5082 domain-containing protein [Heyndrickxia sporothermodurans]MED3654836.1 DUF5082 domain-containing protein [Heyndrickxia sporothermodurans]MED3780214.1 DUF5082 domain-containing protein [Heyndrickxia sporothermodurans]